MPRRLFRTFRASSPGRPGRPGGACRRPGSGLGTACRLGRGALLVLGLAVLLAAAPAVGAQGVADPDPLPAAGGGLDALVATLPGPLERLGTLGERLGAVLDLLGDPRRLTGLLGDLLGWLLAGLAGWLREQLVGLVADPLANVLTRTPPELSYDSPTVRRYWETLRGIANGALALVTLVGGLNLIVRRQLGLLSHEAAELLPRLVVGALLANTSRWWAQQAVDANNALCAAVGTVTLPGWDDATWLDRGVVVVVPALVYLVMGVVLLLQQLLRLALVDVLVVVAPLALLCWVLPQTQGWSALWTTLFVRTTFTQFLQALALALGSALMVEVAGAGPGGAPGGAPGAGPGGASGGETTRLFLSFLVGIATVLLTLKLPGLLHGWHGDGLGFVRYVAYRQGAAAVQAGVGHLVHRHAIPIAGAGRPPLPARAQ